MQIEVTTTADAPADAVFAAAIDIANWPRFISAIERVEVLTIGPLAAGTRFRETRTMFGRRAIEEMTIDAVEPPHRLVLTAFNHGTAYRMEHRFASDGAATRMTLTFDGQPVTLLSRVFAPIGRLFLGSLRRQVGSDLADLRREAERRYGEAAALSRKG